MMGDRDCSQAAKGALIALAIWMLSGLACRNRKPAPPPKPPEPTRVRLVAVGDLLMHQDVQRSARHAGNFDTLWADATPLFAGADIAFANLETPVAPKCGASGRPFVFNAPEELPLALKRSGFSILSTANNHAYDQGTKGLAETLEHLDAAGLAYTGSGRNQAAAETPRILVCKGVRIAFLGYTDIFNHDLNQPGKGPWVNPLDEDRSPQAVREARRQADCVVVSVHWGNEYQHRPTDHQREMAEKLFSAGADLIIGHHPHVLQPLETGHRAGRPVAVAYSLGNFISNQDRIYQEPRPALEGDSRDGMALTATFLQEVAPDGSRQTRLEKTGYVPLWTVNNWREVQAGQTSARDIHVMRTDHLPGDGTLRAQRLERVRGIVGDKMEGTPEVQ